MVCSAPDLTVASAARALDARGGARPPLAWVTLPGARPRRAIAAVLPSGAQPIRRHKPRKTKNRGLWTRADRSGRRVAPVRPRPDGLRTGHVVFARWSFAWVRSGNGWQARRGLSAEWRPLFVV